MTTPPKRKAVARLVDGSNGKLLFGDEARDLLLRFDRPRMLFTPLSPDEVPSKPPKKDNRARGRNGKLLSELADLWNRPAAADDLDDERGDA